MTQHGLKTTDEHEYKQLQCEDEGGALAHELACELKKTRSNLLVSRAPGTANRVAVVSV